jgi:hypothetical protein
VVKSGCEAGILVGGVEIWLYSVDGEKCCRLLGGFGNVGVALGCAERGVHGPPGHRFRLASKLYGAIRSFALCEGLLRDGHAERILSV